MTTKQSIHEVSIKEYQDIHYWLRKNYGNADKCENADCSKASKKYNWALKKGKNYEKVRDNFEMLCRSCHALQDITENGVKRLREINFSQKDCEGCGINYIAWMNQIRCKECKRKWLPKYNKSYYQQILKEKRTNERKKLQK